MAINTVTGTNVILLINGVKAGWAMEFSINKTLSRERINVLGQASAKEFPPTAFNCNFNLTNVRIRNNDLKSLGLFPLRGSSEEEFIGNIYNQEGAEITIQDTNGETLEQLTNAYITDEAVQYTANGVVTMRLTGVAQNSRTEGDGI